MASSSSGVVQGNFGKWQAPPHGWFKVNWKASVDTKNGRVGLGAAIRDHLGTMCVAQTMACPGFLDPTFAEAMAALMAAEICCDLGQLQIQLKGDARQGDSRSCKFYNC